MTATEWKIGDRIENRFQICRIMGGGMSVVYVVYDHESKVSHAAKSFKDEIFASYPDVAERFRQKSLAWVKLDAHENVARADFVLNIAGKPFLFLEYIVGGDLSGWIGTPRLTPRQTLRFAIQFCDGMTHALSKGIGAHRDIKPQNCLVTDDGTLKVTDFDLAKVVEDAQLEHMEDRNQGSRQGPDGGIELTRTGEGAGTAPYMAPEQFSDFKHVDVRADIYSFGVMLFQMFSGRLPFAGRSWQDFQRLHRSEPPPLLPDQPPQVNDILQKCMAKDPGGRLGDFGTLRAGLAETYQVLTGEPAPRPAVGRALGAADWGNKGLSLENLGWPQEALACYDRSLELNPVAAVTWSNKGNALTKLARLQDALACYDRALELDPKLAGVWNNKGFCLGELGRVEESLACYDRALELYPRLARTWYSKGVALYNTGRYQEALRCFREAQRLGDARAAKAIPACRELLGDAAAPAQQEPTAAATESQLDAAAWYVGGDEFGKQGRPAEALVCFEQALKLCPGSAEAWYAKGVVLGQLERPVEELACYSQALAIAPGMARAWFNKGRALAGKFREFQQALECFNKARQLGYARAEQEIALCQKALAAPAALAQPRPPAETGLDAEQLHLKGVEMAEQGLLDKALVCFEQALAISPGSAKTWLSKGVVLGKLGQWDEELACYDRAIALAPGLTEAWFSKGKLLAGGFERYGEALECLEKARELGHPLAGYAIEVCRRSIA